MSQKMTVNRENGKPVEVVRTEQANGGSTVQTTSEILGKDFLGNLMIGKCTEVMITYLDGSVDVRKR